MEPRQPPFSSTAPSQPPVSSAAPSQPVVARRPRRPTPITIAIVAINVAVFAAQTLAPESRGTDAVAQRFAVWAPHIWSGEVWRLFTAAFIHFSVLHIFCNMFVLWDIGRLCEVVVGPMRYALIYVASALGGTVASTLFTAGLSGGASGALFGVTGALLTLVLLDRDHRLFRNRDHLRSMLLRFVVINGVLQFMIPHIDIAAHMGGLVTGVASGGVVFGWSRVAGARGPIIRWTSTAAVIVIVALAGYSLHPVGLPRFERWQGSTDVLIDDLLRPR